MLHRFDLLTIFPKFFDSYLSQSLVGKALEKKLFEVQVHNLRDWSRDKHRIVDDIPYGGGDGMVFKPEPLFEAIRSIRSSYKKGKVVYLSCQGQLWNQSLAKSWVQDTQEILFICGRYEGIDQRVIETLVDEEVSIGDYVLSGGEVAAQVVIDSLVRLIPGFMGKEGSLVEESFESGLLEYPHYTRPEEYEGLRVPEVLLSGNHALIKEWRLEQALRNTLQKRPDLLETPLSEEIKKMLKRFDIKY
ncbi:MAG: tRNA (guanosine(37)-N1)-methyltransferase TrmD [Deltaproteobacteria bacterium]|nr:tRNA (guanosine(37)-N1)-methyltransferase TrmD [Deltaproteobacteria bacterium]